MDFDGVVVAGCAGLFKSMIPFTHSARGKLRRYDIEKCRTLLPPDDTDGMDAFPGTRSRRF